MGRLILPFLVTAFWVGLCGSASGQRPDPVAVARPAGRERPPQPSVHVAVRLGRRDAVLKHLKFGTDINAVDKDGWAPLHTALWYGRKGLAQLLLERGAKVDAFIAAGLGRVERVRRALETDPTWLGKEGPGGTQLIHWAILGRQRELIELLLAQGVAVDQRGSSMLSTPLQLAARQGSRDVVTILLAGGADIRALDKGGMSVMHYAAESGDAAVCKLLMARGAEADLVAGGWRTPLHVAAGEGNVAIVRLLLDSGVDAAAGKANTYPPVTMAAFGGHAEVVELLLKRGAELNPKDEHGRTPLAAAVMGAHHDLARKLLTRGAKPDVQFLVYGSLLQVAIMKRDAKMAQLLLDHGADPNLPGRNNLSLLHFAVGSGNAEIVRLLLKAGAKINARDADGRTPLEQARKRNYAEVIELLQQAAASQAAAAQPWIEMEGRHVNDRHHHTRRLLFGCLISLMVVASTVETYGQRRGRPRSPLYRAAAEGNRGEVLRLLGEGADIDARSRQGSTALQLAVSNGRKEVAGLLLQRGATVDPYSAARLGLADELREALQADVSLLHAKGPDGRTLLQWAVAGAPEEIVQMLIAQGASVKQPSEGRSKVFAIHVALRRGDPGIVKLLLDAGADVHEQDWAGFTALHYAAAGGNAEVVGWMLERKADVHAIAGNFGRPPALTGAVEVAKLQSVILHQAGFMMRIYLVQGRGMLKQRRPRRGAVALPGETALHIAAFKGHEQVVEVLLARKAALDLGDEWYMTPLAMAAAGGHTTIVARLLAAGADVNGYSDDKLTALATASYAGQEEVVKLLLAQGAKVDVGQAEVPSALSLAAVAGQANVVELLLATKPPLDPPGQKGLSALGMAAFGGHVEAVKRLLAAGAKTDPPNSAGPTALLVAAAGGDADVVGVLLEKGANPNVKTNPFGPPLVWAAVGQHREVVRRLLDGGADVNATGERGGTVLHWAAERGDVEIVRMALAKGASPAVKRGDGQSPADVAAKRRQHEIVSLLTEAAASQAAATQSQPTPDP